MARSIPILLIKNKKLVKTKRYRSPVYIGSPKNAARLFTEIQAEELIFLGIDDNASQRYLRTSFLESLAYEAQMPLAYGGGISSLDDARSVFNSGFEKIVINQAVFHKPDLIHKIANIYGSQAVVVSIDYRIIRGKRMVFSRHGSTPAGKSLETIALEAVRYGAGELLITNIDFEGMWCGYDIDAVRSLSDLCTVPLIVNGGCRGRNDIRAVNEINDTSAGFGSVAVFYKKNQGILLNLPSPDKSSI